jgi:hypothetical protein
MLVISTKRNSRSKFRSTNQFALILGGGRWALTLASELLRLDLVGLDVVISTSSGCEQATHHFKSDESYQRIRVVESLKQVDLDYCRFAIVANSARSHFSSAKFLITNGIPTLIEKPVAMSFIEISELVELSQKHETVACASNVYLFSTAVARYSELMTGSTQRLFIEVEWLDNLSTKALGGNSVLYDDSVPIYYDWLPHVISILDYLKLWPMSLDDLSLDHGGSSVMLGCSNNRDTCIIKLSRHESVKSRTLRALSQMGNSTALDFTREPGVVYRNSELVPDNSQLRQSAGPLSKMLTSFISVIEGQNTNSKLDLSIALHAASFIETVNPRYLDAQKLWIERHYDRSKVPSRGIIYAVTERMQADGRMSEDRLNSGLRAFKRKYADSADVIKEYW